MLESGDAHLRGRAASEQPLPSSGKRKAKPNVQDTTSPVQRVAVGGPQKKRAARAHATREPELQLCDMLMRTSMCSQTWHYAHSISETPPFLDEALFPGCLNLATPI